MLKIYLNQDKIAKHFDSLSKIGNLGPWQEAGFFRSAWSEEESEAMDYIRIYAEGRGFSSRFDEVGNLFLSLAGTSGKVVQIGSHLDTVPRGGLFDGGAGIVAGVEALIEVKESCPDYPHELELVIWRAEESGSFKHALCGSQAAFGILPPAVLDNSLNEETMRDAITARGYSAKPIENSLPTLSQERIDQIIAHFELHIEQATFLERSNLDIGVVTSIRGPRRFRITVRGEEAHSGATPLDVKFRSDANLAMSYMQTRFYEKCQQRIAAGEDLVSTVGIVNSDQSISSEFPELNTTAITKICQLAYFTVDIRSNREETLEQAEQDLIAVAEDTAEEFRCEALVDSLSRFTPLESLNPELQDKLELAAEELEYPVARIASGAGHDAMTVAQQEQSSGEAIPTAMVFIPCLDGVSHNPKEFTTNEAVAKGGSVLATAISAL